MLQQDTVISARFSSCQILMSVHLEWTIAALMQTVQMWLEATTVPAFRDSVGMALPVKVSYTVD